MALDHQNHHQNPPQTNLTTILRWPTRRRILLRKRKLPTIRLGGGKKLRKGLSLMRMLRRVRLRWLKLQYTCMLRKLKEYYRNLVKDIMEAGATLETFQQRILMESTFAIPVMGVSFSSFPSVAGSDRPRSFM